MENSGTDDNLWHKEREEGHHVFGKAPSWLLRNGIAVTFCTILTLLLLSYLIRFPDKIQVRVVITTQNPPIRVMAKTDGQVSSLLISNNSKVHAGDIVAVIESSASYEDILRLDVYLKDLNLDKPKRDKPGLLNLGTLQNMYSGFVTALDDYQSFKSGNIFQHQIQSIELQTAKFYDLNNTLNRRKKITENQSDIAKNDYLRNQKLLDEGVISKLDFEKIEINFLNYSNQVETITTEVMSNQLKIYQLSSQKAELERDYREQDRVKKLAVEEGVKLLQAEIISWKEKYLLQSPIEGKLTFTGVKSAKQFVNANNEVFTVVPNANSGAVIGRSVLSGLGTGKVKTGMKVLIQLDGYPYQEFGSLVGIVYSISDVPNKDGYLVEMNVPADLVTTYNRQLPLTQEMQGDGFIITDNRSLLSKIFDSIVSPFKNRV